MNKDIWLIITLSAVGVAMLAWAAVSVWQASRLPAYTPQQYTQALQAELPDKCATPSGYTDAEWQEHMSHHPDRYQECLSR